MSALFGSMCVFALNHVIIAQADTLFYWDDFEHLPTASNWSGNIGSYDPDLGHIYTPIQWRESTRCPRDAAGDTSMNGTRCVQTVNDASLSRNIPTVGFHSIHLQIDAKADDVDIVDDDWCIIQYRTETTNWSNLNIIQGDSYVLNYNVSIPDNNVYNNQESFEVKIGIAANAGGDSCYFDNLKVFGISDTKTPTIDTNHPTVGPSIHPNHFTSNLPTATISILNSTPIVDTSSDPTNAHSLYPTTIPTNVETGNPTLDRTKTLTITSPAPNNMNYDTNNKTNTATNTLLIGVVIILSFILCCCFMSICMIGVKTIKMAKAQRTHVNNDANNDANNDIPNIERICSQSMDDMEEIEIEGMKMNPVNMTHVDGDTNRQGSKCTQCGAVVQQGTIDGDNVFICVICKDLNEEDVDKEVDKMFEEEETGTIEGGTIDDTTQASTQNNEINDTQ